MQSDADDFIKSNKKLSENERLYMESMLNKIISEIPKGKNAFISFST